MKSTLPYILGILLILAGLMHFIKPRFYRRIIPAFLPEHFANISAGIAEVAIGIGLLLPATRSWAGLGFMLLMIVFLPLHVWDVFRERPATGSTGVAVARLLLQFVLIYFGWYLWRE